MNHAGRSPFLLRAAREFAAGATNVTRQPTWNMPLELQIIRATEFIRVGPHGQFDLAVSKAALATLAGACRKRGIQQAMLDLRALRPGPKPVFSPADLLELVNTFPEVGFTHQLRLVILYHCDPHQRARLFASLSSIRGWSVRAFGDFEQALHWLSSGQAPPTQPGRSSAPKRIPIRVLNRELTASTRPAPPRRTRRSPADEKSQSRLRAVAAVSRRHL